MKTQHYVLKAEVAETSQKTYDFKATKTMYGGKKVKAGDTVYLFASEIEGGTGLFAKGIVVSAEAVPKTKGLARQTPRINVVIKTLAQARRPLGRKQLIPFSRWKDGRPETELNFKFFRQATNKLGGISAVAASYLDSFFDPK